MPGEFRIASGYVEVTVRPKREELRAAAQQAATDFETESAGRYSGAGQRAGREFATGAKSTVGRDMEQALGDAGQRAGDRFVRDASGRLRDERGRFVKAGEDIGTDLGDALVGGSGGGGILGRLRTLGDGIGGALSSLTSNAKDSFSQAKQELSGIGDALGTLGSLAGGAWTALKWVEIPTAALELVPPVLYAIGGALASIPALAVGAGLALGALGLGTQGIGAAIGQVFNPPGGGGGGGAAQRADQLASAERNLATAQRDEREAQQALNEARVQAAFDLEDLDLKMERQRENELGAALAIKEAQQALVQATATGDPLQIQRAQLQLQEAVTGLKEAKQQTVELAHQKQEADAKGVEGSDKVVAALDRVQNSTNSVADAQAALRQASVSAAGGAVSAYSKLSPEAKKFVDEIARLKPELVGLQQYVQDRLFVGLDKKLDTWAHVWIPHLRQDLGALAGDANTFTSRLGDDLSKPQFLSAVDRITGVFDRLFTKFTTGGALDKLVTGFGDLVNEASPFIESLAGSAIDKLGGAADALDRASKNGSLGRFFKEAAHDARDLWNIGKDVFEIVGKILGIAFGEDVSRHNGQNGLDRLKDTLDKINHWLDSEGGRKTIKDIVDGFITVSDAIGTVVKWVATFVSRLDGGARSVKGTIDGWKADFRGLGDDVGGVFDGLTRNVLRALKGIIDGADDAFSWVPGLGPKLDRARKEFDSWADGVNASLDAIHAQKTITLKVVDADYRTSTRGNRWGGVWAEQGLVSLGRGSAGIYPPGPLYGFAEPDTGGELFMPRNGDAGRNKALATVAAQWAGLDVAPARSPIAAGMGMGPSSSPPVRVQQPVVVQVGNDTVAQLMVEAITDHPVVVSASAAKGDRTRRFTNSARA